MPCAVTEESSFAMSTEITYRVFGENAQSAISAAKSELTRLEQKLSRYIADSEVSKINQSAGAAPVEISEETYDILKFALELSEISEGLFDITVAPLIDLWDYKHKTRVPTDSKIASILPMVNFRDLVLSADKKTACLRRAGQSIDLGGIGKGYASDRCVKALAEQGVSSAFVNIGGNVSTLGNKPDGAPWRVGIRHPRVDGRLIGAVSVTGKAVVTSGDYERYFIDRRGRRWHHILSPTTGYPAQSGLTSVTVVADSAMAADALSTAIFVAGINGLRFLNSFSGAEAIVIDDNLQVYITKGLIDCFQADAGIMVTII